MWREILGLEKKQNNLVELITPKRSFADVILPEETKQQLYEALTCPKHFLRFSTEEGAGEHCECGARALFHQRAFDWLDAIFSLAGQR